MAEAGGGATAASGGFDWGALLGSVFSGGSSLLGGLFGGDAQSDSLDAAIDEMRRQRRFQRRVYEETVGREAPFNALALERSQFGNRQLPTIQNRLDNPTLSPGFDLAMKEGLDALRSNFSASGSPSSGPAQIAGGRFAEGLANDELGRFNENLYRAAGFQGQLQPSQGPAIVNQIGDTTKGIADLTASQGAVKGGLYSSTGNTIGQLPFLWELMKMNRPNPTTATPGFGNQYADVSWSGYGGSPVYGGPGQDY